MSDFFDILTKFVQTKQIKQNLKCIYITDIMPVRSG